MVMRAAAAIAALAMLGGCAGEAARTAAVDKPDTGKWQFDRTIDPISGSEVASAWLVISKYDFPSGNVYAGGLRLLCFKKDPVVRFLFSAKVGTDKTAAVAYRFDDRRGHEVKAKFFAREGMIVIDDRAEVAQFVSELATARSLVVRISRLTRGNLTARFPVHGASHAIEAAFAACPVSDTPKIRTSARTPQFSGMPRETPRRANT